MIKISKRLLGGLLCALVLITALPLSAFAADGDAWDGKTIDVSWYNETDTEFYLSTPEQLMGLAAIVNGLYNKEITKVIGDSSYIEGKLADAGTEGAGSNQSTSEYYYGMDDFNGKTIYLTADLDMGGMYNPETDTWSGPRYMPIGGQYLMEKDDTTTKLSSSFCGTLDGQGHYILNIYCERHASKNFGDGQSVGVIGRLGVHDNDPLETRPAAPTVRNLGVTGFIRANRSVGGVVGKVGKNSGEALIENCVNYATVQSTDGQGCGGIVGANWNDGELRDCYNAGAVSTSYLSCQTGGIAGSNENKIFNCYSVGMISAPVESFACGIGSNHGGYDVDNCFWLSGSAPGGGYWNGCWGTVDELSEDKMKEPSFAARLGEAFAPDTQNKNNGYPLLLWQAENETNPQDPPPAPPPPIVYTDVLEDWYADAVDYVVQTGLFDLVEEETFAPEAPMTRLMLAEALYRLAGSPEAGESPFTDCSAQSVAWASEKGVVNGMGDGTFAPNNSITREEIAAMFYRYAEKVAGMDMSPSTSLDKFVDAGKVSSYAKENLQWAVALGLINGVSEFVPELDPQGTAIRAQVALILQRFTAN